MNSLYKKIIAGICIGCTILGSSIMYVDFLAKSAYQKGEYKKALQYSLKLKKYLIEHQQIYMNAGAQELFTLGMYKIKTNNEPYFEKEHDTFIAYISQESKKNNINADFIYTSLISQVYADTRIMKQIGKKLLEDMKKIEMHYDNVSVDQKKDILHFVQGIFFYNQVSYASMCLTEKLNDSKLIENRKIFDDMLEYERCCDPNKVREMQGEYRYKELYVELIQVKYDYLKMLNVYLGTGALKNTELVDNIKKQLYESVLESHEAIDSSGKKIEEIQSIKKWVNKNH